jgi:hypothetical protein
MQNLIESILNSPWTSKTLDVLRYEAAGEDSGLAFDALRVESGKRLAVVICSTDSENLRVLESNLQFRNEGPPADWSKLTLAEFIVKAMHMGGIAYEDYLDADGKRVAMAFAASGPDAVYVLGHIFQFPP